MSVKTDRVCDRCGKSVGVRMSILSCEVPIHMRLKKIFGLGTHNCVGYDHDYDLCTDCTDSFDKWLKEGYARD